MRGAVQPASSIRCLISGTVAAASGRLTVTRTISEPASASSMHWRAVATASAVSVIVIDCTTTGAPPPTWTWPTRTPTVRWSRAIAGTDLVYQVGVSTEGAASPAGLTPRPTNALRAGLSDVGPAVAQQDAVDVVGTRQRQLHGLVVLGPVHLP